MSRTWIGLCAVLCIASASTTARGEQVTETWPNGQTRVSYTTNSRGEKHGKCYEFYEDGTPRAERTYVNGKLSGLSREHHANGQQSARATYRNDRLHGKCERYDEQGRLVESLAYVEGQLSGRCRYYEQGELVAERTYVGGALLYPRSAAEIRKALARIAGTKVEVIGVDPRAAEGDARPPLTDEQVRAMRTLMSYRYLCGVPWEQLVYDRRLIAHADAASELLQEIGTLDHTPKNPGWPEDKYRFAYKGTSSSNLSMGSSVSGSIHRYMDDSDASNIDRVGHRRWCLNPAMGKTGIAGRGQYSAMWSMDQSYRHAGNYDFIAYPAPGMFPASYFGARHAWSVTLNPRRYDPPRKDKVKVVVRPVRVAVASGTVRRGKEIELDFYTVDTGGFGVPNCIIFRPSKLELRPGTIYEVQITGAVRKDGSAEPVRYFVEFVRL